MLQIWTYFRERANKNDIFSNKLLKKEDITGKSYEFFVLRLN